MADDAKDNVSDKKALTADKARQTNCEEDESEIAKTNAAKEQSPEETAAMVVAEEANIHKPLDQEACKREKIQILKNLFILSTGFLFLFTAFLSLQNLQSSLNPDKGLGLASLSVIYAALVLSCMFVPPYLIGRLGCKWTLVISMVSYVIYTGANYYAQWWTLIPASILIGASAAPLWSSKCAYLTTTGIRFAEISGEHSDVVITRFFGIFYLMFQCGQILGNLISSLVLDQGGPDVFRLDAGQVCGVHFCDAIPKTNLSGNTTETDTLAKPEYSLVIKLVSVYLGCGVLAVLLMIVLLDRLTGSMSRKKESVGGLTLLVATLRHLKDRRMQLVLPMTVFSGLQQAFTFGEFTKAFVTCSIGIHNVGYIMICFGVTDAAFSYILGRLTQYTGRLVIFLSGLLVHLTVIITMLSWSPDADLVWVFYVLAALQGYGDAVWQTQLNALYGVYFSDNQEAAFSNLTLWEAFAFVVAFGYSTALCTSVKLIILTIVLVISFVMYLLSEWVHRKRTREMSLEGNVSEEMKVLQGKEDQKKYTADEDNGIIN